MDKILLFIRLFLITGFVYFILTFIAGIITGNYTLITLSVLFTMSFALLWHWENRVKKLEEYYENLWREQDEKNAQPPQNPKNNS